MTGLTRHTQATRRVILEAAADLFVEREGDDFSVQEVADRAGLNHRTVYRYFPSRLDLIGATAEQLVPALPEDPFIGVSTVEDWIDAVGPYFIRTEENFEVIRKVVAAMLASQDEPLLRDGLHARDAHRWEVFRGQFPHLADDDARRTYATLRHLLSSTSYVLFRLRFGMSPTEATETIRSAASQIAERAARRDRAVKKKR